MAVHSIRTKHITIRLCYTQMLIHITETIGTVKTLKCRQNTPYVSQDILHIQTQ